MAEISQAMLKDVLDAYVERDVPQAVAVWDRDDEVDAIYNSLFRELSTYMLEDPRNISASHRPVVHRQEPGADRRPRDQHRREDPLHDPRPADQPLPEPEAMHPATAS